MYPYGFSLFVLAIVAVVSFMLGGGAVYMGTTIRQEQAPEQKEDDFVFIRDEEPPVEVATTTEGILEQNENEEEKEEVPVPPSVASTPKPKPAPEPVATPKPKPSAPTPLPQPAAIFNTVTPSVTPTTITLPNGAVAELDSKGNIIRYISGGPEGGALPPPKKEEAGTVSSSSGNAPSVSDFIPQPGNRIVKFPNGSIAEVKPDGSLVKLHYTP